MLTWKTLKNMREMTQTTFCLLWPHNNAASRSLKKLVCCNIPSLIITFTLQSVRHKHIVDRKLEKRNWDLWQSHFYQTWTIKMCHVHFITTMTIDMFEDKMMFFPLSKVKISTYIHISNFLGTWVLFFQIFLNSNVFFFLDFYHMSYWNIIYVFWNSQSRPYNDKSWYSAILMIVNGWCVFHEEKSFLSSVQTLLSTLNHHIYSTVRKKNRKVGEKKSRIEMWSAKEGEKK